MSLNTPVYRLAALLIGIAVVGLPSMADTPSPFLAKWVLNIPKSNFGSSPPLKSEAFSMTDPGDGLWHSTVDYQEGDKKTHIEYTTAGDGKSVPVTGTSEVDSVAVTKVDDSTVKFVFKKSGKRVEWGTWKLSKSGKSLRGPISGLDPDGKNWTFHYVFDRQ